MTTIREHSFKNIEIHSLLELLPGCPVDVLEDVKRSEFQVCFVERNVNEEQGQSFCKQKISPRRLQIHRYIEFSHNVGWKMMAMISLKMRNLGFEIFFESGFPEINHCLKYPCSISKGS